MTDFYLAFTDEAAAKAVLYRIEGAVEADPEQGIEAVEGYEVPNYANIDTLGVLYERQEVTDPDNPPEPIPIPGWHVNVRVVEGEDPTALQAYEVHPATPLRVWA
jgi:hypothetical protein